MTHNQPILPRNTRFLCFFVCLLLSVSTHSFGQKDNKVLAEKVQKVEQAASASISFIENKGQWPSHILYRADMPGGQMLATPQGMMIGMYDPHSLAEVSAYESQLEEIQTGHKPGMTVAKLGPAPALKGHGWKFNFVGGTMANAQTMSRSGESPDYYNYLIGDASTHATNVHAYTELVYKNVYQGVDVKYYNAPGGDLENDIIVHPGADARQVKVQMDGIADLKLNKDGELVLATTVGDVVVPHPVSYLVDAQGHHTAINVAYQLIGGNQLSFQIPDYDKTQTLVIDPIVMRWATWVSAGSSAGGHNHAIDVDASGNIYTTGWYTDNLITVGAFQTSNLGSQNVFIGKYIEPAAPGGAGQRVWQTYLGTTGGDNPYALNLGLDGNIYITGLTSGNFARTYGTGAPANSWATQRTTNGTIAQQGWVAKVSPAGTWALVREIGSATNSWSPTLYDIRVVPTGASTFDLVVVGGVTQAATGADGDITAAITPAGAAKTTTGDVNGLVFRISSDLNTLSWVKQYSSSNANVTDIFKIASVDASGNIYIGGYTDGSTAISYNNPSGQTTLIGAEDGWLMKLTGTSGVAAWSRYFNASAGNSQEILCMEFNRAKTNLIIGGTTTGAAAVNITTATTYGGAGDFFVASLPASGAATNWGTYYGGNQQEYNMMGLNVDQNDDIYVLGYTYSKNIATVDFPIESSTFNNNTSNRQSIFFKLSGATGATVLYSTLLGGSGDDSDPIGERGIKFSNCRIYLCISSVSNDFPLTAGTLTSTKTSGATSTLEPLLMSLANPPDLQGNTITGGANQTITCGQTPAAITASVPTYIIPTIIRNNVNQTNGTTGAYPNGLPPINTYQWQLSTDSGYTWTNIAGATAQNYTPSNLTVTGIIKFRRIINGDACNRAGDTLALVNILVNPTSPSPVVGNNSPLCAGQTLQLTANTVAGATYSWTGPNGFSSTLQNPTVTNVTSLAAGTYSCKVINSANSCPSYASTTVVSVTTQPGAPTPGSNSPLCSGKTLNLTVTGVSGATFSWTGPNAFTSTSATPSIVNVSSLNAGTYFVTQTLGSCSSTSASIVVQVDTISNPTALSATPNPLCSGQTLTLSATALSGATLNWTFPDGGTATGSPVVRNNVTTAMAGIYSVTQTLGGCTSAAVTTTVTINLTPGTPTITAPASICAGASLSLSATGVGGASFTWAYPDGGGTTGTPAVRNPVTAAMGGTYTLTQTVSGCTSPVAATASVTVNPLPIITATSSAPKYCSGGTLSLSTTVTSASSPFTYVWSGPDTFSSTQANPSRGAIVPAMTGVYNVTVTDNKGCSAAASTPAVKVNQSPTVTASANNTSFCTGGTITLSAAPSAGSTYTYSWTGPSGFTSTLASPSVSSITTGAAGVYTVVVTDTNGCTATGSTSSLVVHSSPTVAAASTSASYCSGATISLTSTVTGGSPAFTYVWSGPNGFANTSANPSISPATTAMSGTYNVIVTDNFTCTATGSTAAVTVTQSPTLAASSTASAYCAGTTITLNSLASGTASPFTYVWSGPASFSSHTKDTTRSNITTAMSGIYSVVATDANGCTATASTGNITVNPGFTVNASSNSPVCAGGTINLTSSSTGGTAPFTYSWSATSYTSAIQNPSRSGASTAMTGVYSVTITDNNGCSSIGTTSVVVNAATTVNVSSNSPVCVGDSIKLLAAPASGTSPFTYTWSGPISFASALANPGRGNALTTYSGSYAVTATDVNGCSGTGSTSIVVNPLPVVTATSTAPKYCSGTTLSLTSSVTSAASPFTYVWSGPDTFSRNLANPTRGNAVPAMTGIYTVTVTDNNGCKASASTPSVKVNQSPTVTASANSAAYCTGATINLTSAPSAGSTYTYSWTGPNGFTSTVANPSISNATTSAAGVYTVVVLDTNGCSASGSTSSIVVNASPTISASSLSANYCTGATVSLSSTVTGGTANFSYVWSGPNGYSNTLASPSFTATTTLASGVYSVTVTDNNTCTASGSTAAVTVFQSPTATASSPSAAYCAGTTITLNSSAATGTAPYSYVWSGPVSFTSHTKDTTRSNVTTAMSGVYSVTVTDAHQCSATASTANITVNPSLTANASSNSPVCAGGTLNLFASSVGGTSPFTYSWSATSYSSTTQNPTRSGASAAMAGLYTVTVTDKNGCFNTDTTTVVVNPATTVNVSSNSPVCLGDSIILLATPASGTAPYTYNWSGPVSFGATIANPGRGNALLTYGGVYSVTAIDVNGCSAVGTKTVQVNPLPIVTASATSAGYCVGTTIQLNAAPSAGTPPYSSYSWSGPPAFTSNLKNPSISNADTTMAGSYVVTLTDSKGCSAQNAVSILIYKLPVVSAGSNQTSCSGSTVTIGGSPTASGGNPPFTYIWNNGAGTSSNPSVAPSITTTYAVTVTDNKTCSATGSTTVNVNSTPTANAGNDKSIASCSLIGTVIGGAPTASGGTAPYTYLWAPAAGLSSPDSSNPAVHGIGSTTPYTVTVTDANGCTASDLVIVTVTGSSLTVNITANTATAWCSGGATSTTFTANANGGSGSGTYSFSWTGNSLSTATGVSTVANPSVAGSYTYGVIVTDLTGCQSGDTASITVYPTPSASAGASNYNICRGDSVTLGGNPTAIGGTAPFTYAWNNGAAPVSGPTVNPTNTTTYTVTVTDAHTCTAIASSTVTVRSNPVADAGADVTLPSCSPTGIQIGGSPTASGGAGLYTFIWSPLTGLSSGTVANPIVQGIITNQTYTVTVTDGNGCSSTDQVLVRVTNNTLTANITAGGSTAWCEASGGSVVLTASLTGGTGTPTYAWSGTSISPINAVTATVNPNTAGSYTYNVTVTDGFNCTATTNKTITVYALPVADGGIANNVICNGDTVTIGANPTASGGTSPYTYAWNNGAGNIANPKVFPTGTTTYTVTVTDNKLCSATANTTVSVNPKPVANAGVDKTIPSCSLVGTTIGGSPTASGGTSPFIYKWSPATGLSSADSSNPTVLGIGTTTPYTVTVTDINGCKSSDLVIVNVTTTTLASNIVATGATAWCAGLSSVTFTANTTGGAGGYTYSWTGANLSANTTASTIANPNTAGSYTYHVTVTDAVGCQVSDTANIVVYPTPTANAGVLNTNICRGDSVRLGGSPTATGGTASYSYAWNNGAASVSNPTVTPISTTTYTLTVTDAHTCTAVASATVTVRSNPVANAGADVTLPACSPTGIQIGGSPTASGGAGSYSYAWSPSTGLSSATAANPTVQGITSDQTYTVTVSDVNGCASTDQVIVHVSNNPPSVGIFAGGSTSWCAGSGGSVFLAANVIGGTGALTYVWSGTSISPTNAPTATVNPNTANTYTYYVTVTDGFNCTATASKVITVNALPVASAGAPNYTICKNDSVTIGGSPTAVGGSGTYTYTWNNGAASVANPTVTPLSNTTYGLTVSDGNSCSATATTTVNVRTNPIANAGVDKTMPSCTPTGLTIGGSPAASGGGGTPYTYQWSPTTGLSSSTVANPTVVGLSADTTYTLVVTDVNGCKASDQMILHITNNTPFINITSSGNTSWCAGTNSSVNLTANVTGGTTAFTYSWSGTFILPVNSQVATVYPNSAGQFTYVVTVTDGFNCTATSSKVITVNSIPTVSAGPLVHNICPGNGVSIGGTQTAAGGTLPYTYAWNSGANPVANPTVTPINSTTYIVTVTDSAGCSATASTTVLVRPAVIANAGADQNLVSCSNSCAIIGGSPTGSGGSGTLTYAWGPSTGLSSTTVANPTACALLGNTNYTVTVTDTAGCSATDQVAISLVNSTLSAEAGTGGHFCLGSGDSIMLGGYPTAVGGTPIYTYTWSPTNGLNLQNPANPVAYPLLTTMYHLTVTDSKGCTAVDSVLIQVNQPVQAHAGNDTTVCEGSSVRIGGNPTATGGNGIYTYLWGPNNNISGLTIANPTVSPSISVNYSVTVIDSNGCRAKDNVVITVRSRPVAQAGPDKAITACPLDSVVIGESPSAVSGTPPYTYVWTPSTGLSSTSATNPIVTGLTTTQTYLLTVTDTLGCIGTDNVVVNVVPTTLQAFALASQQICGGPNACVQLGGLPTVIGGVSPYIYVWSGAVANPNSSNPIACPTTNSTYGLTVTDSKGCSVTASQYIAVRTAPTVNAGSDTAVCLGQPVRLGASPTASGGSGRGFTYSWTPTSGISSTVVANPISTATATTTYTVFVTDSNGCSASDDILVTVMPLPSANAGPDKTLSICSRDSVFIGSLPVATGGTAPYSYLWTPATGLTGTTIANPIVSGITQTASYHIVVTDSFGCKASDNVVINVTQSTLQAQAGSVRVVCASSGTPVTIGGRPTATGGTSPYQYSWGPSAGLSSTTIANPIATVSATTTYYVTVTDAKGCISIDSVKITQNAAPVVNAGTDTAVCLGFGKTLGGTPTAAGGTGAYQYSWTPTNGLNANNTSNPSAYPLTTTTYQVVVTDSLGCQAADAVTIVINQNPTANAGADMIMTSCIGDTVQIGGTPSASGGSGSYTYAWAQAGGLSSTSVANPFVTGLASSTLYGLTVTDANGCVSTDAMLVTVTRPNLSADAGNNVSICNGSNTIVTLGGNPTPTGGTAPYSYTWSNAASLNSPNVSNPFATPATTTGYVVTVTDAKGCTASDSVTVTVNTPPSVNAGLDTTVCAGNAVQAGGSPTASGFAPYTYSWSPTIGLSNTTASNPLISATATTTYTVTVSDGHGCTATDDIQITVHQRPTADAGTDKSLVACNADSVMIGGTPAASAGLSPYTYSWSPSGSVSSSTIANPYVSHLGSNATFTLLVTDQNGCTASDQMLVTVTGSSLFADAGNNVAVCKGSSNLVTLGGIPTASGGTGGYTYTWSPAAGLSSTSSPNPAALPIQTTLYTLVVKDGAGCIATDTVDFVINPKPVVDAGPNDTLCQGICVTLGGAPTADGNAALNTYAWSPSTGLNDPTLANPTSCTTVTTRYNLSVTNEYGCTAVAAVNVKINTKPTVNAGPDLTIVACPNSCITIGGSPTALGGTAPYGYSWSPGLYLDSTTIANPTLCNLKGQRTYTVTVTDANGCSASDDVLIQPIASDLTADAGPDKTICAGQNNSCITIGGSPSILGGTAPYMINWSPAANFCTATNVTNPQVNPINTTTYTILVTDAKGCISRDTMTLTANPAVTAVVRPDTSVCAGASAILGGYPSTGSGGTAPYTYAWSPTIGLLNPSSGNPIVNTIVTTTYCVTVTDTVGCSTSACMAVKVNTQLVADAGPDKTISGCPNSSVFLGGTPAVHGGSGSYSYSWTPTTGLDSAQTANPHVVSLGTTTTYTLVVTDRITGCSASDQVLVSVNPTTLAVNAGTDQFLCYDNHTGVQIGGIPTATGGQGPYVYHWSPATGLSDTTGANPIALPTATTSYVVSVTDAVGCGFTDTVVVTVVQRVPVSFVGLNNMYCLNAGNITLVGSPSGGTFSGPGVAGNTFQPSLIGVGTWCLKYSRTDAVSGCVSDTVVCVVVDSLPTLKVTGYSSSYCHNDSAITLVGSPSGGTFSGTGIAGNTFLPANAAIGNNVITYTYTDTMFGCSNTTQFTINVKAIPSLSIAASDSIVCPGGTVSLSAQYSTDVFNIAWSDATGSTIYSGLNAFNVHPSLTDHCYVATAVNTPGCVVKDSLCIALYDCTIHGVNELCDADTVYQNGTININVLGNDVLPAPPGDTIVTIRTSPIAGTVIVNSDHTITYIAQSNFSGTLDFSYQVCVVVKGFSVCDTADVCVTVVDSTIHCHFPNTITPNNDGVNDAFEISCNSDYPNSEIRIYDRWGAEIYRSTGQYTNDWKGYNQQGTAVPDGTYFYMYYYHDGTNRMKKGFVDVYR